MAMEPQLEAVSPRKETNQQMPPKFSRYRSVRKAAADRQAHEPPPPPVPPPANPAIARSMSRYRRNKPTATAQTSEPLPPLPTAQIPRHNGDNMGVEEEENVMPYGGTVNGQRHPQSGGRGNITSREVSGSSGENAPSQRHPVEARMQGLSIPPTKGRVNGDHNDGGGRGYSSGMERSFYSDAEHQEDHRAFRKHGSEDHIRNTDRPQERTRRSTNTSRTQKAEYFGKQREDFIPGLVESHSEVEEDRHGNETAAERHLRLHCPKPLTLRERLALGSRGGKNDGAGLAGKDSKYSRENLKKSISSPRPVEPGEIPALPGADGPVAAHAEVRKVQIKFNGFSMSLPIAATTTPQDMLYAAKHFLSDDIDPHTSFLMESFTQLELNRPLRMYEHVRDVLNSWDTDGQNNLMVQNRCSESLKAAGAPTERPGDSSFHLYHSQRPGKWHKRWVTLRSDGQVVVSKKIGVEQSNICHLSDFDIYTPSPYQVSKKLKPPKSICYAIKSQQKSNLFVTTENFVHYFCSNDETLTNELYKSMQEWRSWYLADVLGKVQPEKKQISRLERSRSSAGSTPPTSLHRRSLSAESTSNHHLPNFKPFINLSMDQFGQDGSDPGSRRNSQRSSSRERSNPNGTLSRRQSKRSRGPPPTAANGRRLSLEPDGTTSLNNSGTLIPGATPEEGATFAPTGLLGRTYSQRQKAQREREQAQAAQQELDGPFSPGGLISNANRDPASATASPLGPRSPTGSQLPPGQPQPLVDLTPVYKEPPHHQRSGRGRGVQVEPGKQLVDVATGPGLLPGAIVVPSSTVRNRPGQGTLLESPPQTQANNNNGGGLQRNNTTRTVSNRYQNQSHPPLPGSPTGPSGNAVPDSPFTSTGLLARSSTMAHAQGAATRGRGVATGDRNAVNRPLLNISEQGKFLQGSLLNRVEQWDDGHGHGSNELIIDREREGEGLVNRI